jgi:polyribonucleotide nucleotidyltransferase
MVELQESELDLVVASTRDAIVMVEAGAKEVPKELLIEAIKAGHLANQDIIRLQDELRQICGKAKREFQPPEIKTEIVDACSSISERLTQALSESDRANREKAINEIQASLVSQLGSSYAEGEIASAFDSQLKKCVRARILDKQQHVDGRRNDEIRPITCQVGLLPRTHGSGLFARGLTQVMTITTLGSKGEEQMLDGLGIEETKRFMHHYNFPPFSTGEVKRVGSPGRREIGHGALVERAISRVLPSESEFPYTIRLVSEVLSSNGSTSMASVCGSSLSLMDAGVPIKSPVAGIAMGLVIGDDGKQVVLTDIEGMEDACGDMDFKVAGTAKGVTALQLDMKRPGLSWEVLADAIGQGCKGYLFVLDKIKATISASRSEMSRFAPRIYQVNIPVEKIGAVIGPGGKTIRSIIEKTKVSIDVGDDGKVQIGSNSEEAAQAAIHMIEDLTREVARGSVYTGKVTRIFNFGAMVEILPGKEGLVHISELAPYRVNAVEDVVKVGDEVMVKVVEIDRQGRVNLSRKAVFDDKASPPGSAAPTAPEHGQSRERRPSGPPRPHGGGGRRHS